MKKCNKCGVEKDIINFSKNKQTRDGIENICKECKKIYKKKWYEENKEYALQYVKKYNEENREKVLSKKKEYRDNHKEDISKKYKIWYKKNTDKRAKYRIEWYSKNRKLSIILTRNWQKRNPERVKLSRIEWLKKNPNYYSDYVKNNLEKYTNLSLRKFISFVCRKDILKRDNYCCQLCKSKNKLELHHILPVKNDIESNYIDDPKNLIILCRECHLKKAHNGYYGRINNDIIEDLIKIANQNEANIPSNLPSFTECA